MIPPPALAIISAAILAYEVLLIRLFAIVQWHHFAFMAISIALLGFGVSGTLIVLIRDRAERMPGTLFTGAAALFAITAPGTFLLAQQVPFNAPEVIWAPSQLLSLALIYALLVVPFTAGATCVGLAFREPGAVPGRVYLWNLLGSGAGALGSVGALLVLSPMGCLAIIGALGLAASVIAAARRQRASLALLAGLVVGVWWIAPAGWTALHVSEFKDLPRTLAVSDARLLTARSGPLALISVVESPSVPFHYAPGLSLTAPALPPPQLGIFVDGAFAGAVDRWDGNVAELAYLDHSPDALAYHLSSPPDVLVLEPGGGRLVLQALSHSAERVDAVESNPQMLMLMRGDVALSAGGLYARPDVFPALADPRHFLTAADRQWGLIQLPPLGGGSVPARGLDEEFLYTAEGVARAYSRLSPGGWLSATMELDLPPRTAFKLASTLRAALLAEGVSDPDSRIIAIRSMSTIGVLAKSAAITDAEIAAAKAFADTSGFDLVHHPGMERAEANRRIRLAEPVFHDGFRAILGPDHESFVASYKFDISAATDDRPYFHDVFRWSALAELLALGPAGGAALIELGELIVTATLVQALILGAILVLLPLRLRLAGRLNRGPTWRFGLYFATLGLAFLFIEIAWIQRFVLFLGHPLYAVSVALTGFLIFAAVGAGVSARLERRLAGRAWSALDIAIAGIVAITLLYLAGLSPVLEALSGLPTALRIPVALVLIAPLGFFMGMPFPLGLARIARADADFVAWAWGLNGCASVVSAAAATLISMNFGISTTVLLGAALYAAAALLLRGVVEQPAETPTI